MSFKGDLSTIGLAEVFQMISMSQKEGTLIVQDAESRRAIYFGKEGVQLLSSGKRKGFRIGDLLVRAGKISVGQLREVLERQEASKKLLGEELIEAGIVTQSDIEEVVRSQIEEEIYDLFLWKKAAFEFIEGPPIDELRDPDSRAIRLSLDVNGLLLEAVRRTDEWTLINQKLPSMDCVFSFVSDAARAEAEASGNDTQKSIYANVDGQATVNDIVEASLVPRFEVCKVMVELLDGGRVRMMSAQETAAVAKQRLEEGRREKGFRLFQVAVILAPEDPDLIGTYAHALETEGMIQDAARMYVKVGNLLKAQGAGKDALAYFQRAVSLNPDDAGSKAALFEINIASGNVEEALQAAHEVIANAVRDKDYQAAKIVAEQAVAAAPQNLDMRLSLAKVYHGLGMKGERDEVIGYLRKNLPVDGAAADRIMGEIRQMTEGQSAQPKLITTTSTKKEKYRGRRSMMLVMLVIFLVLVGATGIAAKYEIDANREFVATKSQAIEAEAKGDFTLSRRLLSQFETKYPYSILTLPKVKTELASLPKREEDYKKAKNGTKHVDPIPNGNKDPIPVDPDKEEEDRRKAALAKLEQLLQDLIQCRQRAEHEKALETAKLLKIEAVDYRKKWPKHGSGADAYEAQADKYDKEISDFLAKADAMWQQAMEQEKEGRYKDAALTIDQLRNVYFSTKVAQEARYPLMIRVRPKRVKVMREEPGKPAVELFEGEEKLIRIDAKETFTLRFTKESFEDVVVAVNNRLMGEVNAVLDKKTARWAQPVSLILSAAPEVFQGQIYVGGDTTIYGIDEQQRLVKWKQEGQRPSVGTAVRIGPDGILYAGVGPMLRGYDRTKSNERPVFEFRAAKDVISPPAFSAAGDVAYFGCDDGCLYAVRVGTPPGIEWKYDLKAPVKAEPLEAQGVLYIACTDGVLYKFKIGEKGLTEVWRRNLGGSLEAAPYIAGKQLYIGSTSQRVFAVNADTGEVEWQAPVGGEVRATPALSNGRLFVPCSDKSMYAFDTQGARAGRQAWSFPTRGAVTSPVVVGSQVLFGSEDGAFYCVDAERGRQEWRFDTKGKIRKSAARGDGVVIFGSDDQNLYCVPIDAE